METCKRNAFLISCFSQRGLRHIFAAVSSLIFVLGFLEPGELYAVRNRYYDDQNVVVVREMRDSLEDLRHEVNNHESEIRMYDEKIKNLESIIDSLREQSNKTSRATIDQLGAKTTLFDTKIDALEVTSNGLIADLRQFKTHANEISTAIGQTQKKLTDLEAITEQQNQNIDHLQAAMRSLMEALAIKETQATNTAVRDAYPNSTYQVKAGDSLGEIARLHKTSVKAIKSLNGLEHDRIIVGQILKLPEK